MELEEIERTVNIAWRLEDSVHKTELLDGVIRACEVIGREDLAFEARLQYIQSTIFSGEVKKAMVAFAWCIAKHDAEEEWANRSNDVFHLMWSYKWIISTIIGDPTIPLSMVEDIEDEMLRRYERQGLGHRYIHVARWRNGVETGRFDRAHVAREEWQKHAFDSECECLACDDQHEITFQEYEDNHERVITLSDRLLKSRRSCNRIPGRTFTTLMFSLLKTGQTKRATAVAHQGAIAIEDMDDPVVDASRLLMFFSHQSDLDRAETLFNQFNKQGLTTLETDAKTRWVHAATLFLGKVDNTKNLKFDKSFALFDINSDYDLGELRDYYTNSHIQLADAYDARNGNTAFSELDKKTSNWFLETT